MQADHGAVLPAGLRDQRDLDALVTVALAFLGLEHHAFARQGAQQPRLAMLVAFLADHRSHRFADRIGAAVTPPERIVGEHEPQVRIEVGDLHRQRVRDRAQAPLAELQRLLGRAQCGDVLRVSHHVGRAVGIGERTVAVLPLEFATVTVLHPDDAGVFACARDPLQVLVDEETQVRRSEVTQRRAEQFGDAAPERGGSGRIDRQQGAVRVVREDEAGTVFEEVAEAPFARLQRTHRTALGSHVACAHQQDVLAPQPRALRMHLDLDLAAIAYAVARQCDLSRRGQHAAALVVRRHEVGQRHRAELVLVVAVGFARRAVGAEHAQFLGIAGPGRMRVEVEQRVQALVERLPLARSTRALDREQHRVLQHVGLQIRQRECFVRAACERELAERAVRARGQRDDRGRGRARAQFRDRFDLPGIDEQQHHDVEGRMRETRDRIVGARAGRDRHRATIEQVADGLRFVALGDDQRSRMQA